MIRVVDLHKQFGHQEVLKGLNLELKKGVTTVILGRSGQGKSVLLKHIIGLLKPDSGQIFLGSDEITSFSSRQLSTVRKRFGMLFQDAALFDSMNVFDNVAFPLVEHFDLSDDELRKRVKKVLEHVHLSGVEEKWPSELSGGMRKRVGLARALVHEPEIMLYDEPTTGLDPITSDQINWLINYTRDRLGITSVVISHDLSSTRAIADQIAMLHNGRIVETGTPETFFSTTNQIVQHFLRGRADHVTMEEH